MRKVYKLENLDCAHCAAKLETAVQKLDGVKSAAVNFMAQRMIVESELEAEELTKQIKEVIKRIEPDCRIVS